jgi:DNA-binding transcriptional MerR regulator
MTMVEEFLRTSQIAKAVGVHPNTVRLYEEWGLLPAIPRTPSGYRKFTPAHLDQMRLARASMQFNWLSGDIRQTAYQLSYRGAKGDYTAALELAYHLRALLQAELALAETAADFLENWAQGITVDATQNKLRIGEVAELLNTTRDRLRNWERNGLIDVPRDMLNGYRYYRAREIGRLRVIRALCQARYSQMAILRMLLRLDEGQTQSLRQVLDTPRDDEDIFYVTDQLLTALRDLEIKSKAVIDLIGDILQEQV